MLMQRTTGIRALRGALRVTAVQALALSSRQVLTSIKPILAPPGESSDDAAATGAPGARVPDSANTDIGAGYSPQLCPAHSDLQRYPLGAHPLVVVAPVDVRVQKHMHDCGARHVGPGLDVEGHRGPFFAAGLSRVRFLLRPGERVQGALELVVGPHGLDADLQVPRVLEDSLLVGSCAGDSKRELFPVSSNVFTLVLDGARGRFRYAMELDRPGRVVREVASRWCSRQRGFVRGRLCSLLHLAPPHRERAQRKPSCSSSFVRGSTGF